MADAVRVIARLKTQVGEQAGEIALLAVELEETRDALDAALGRIEELAPGQEE